VQSGSVIVDGVEVIDLSPPSSSDPSTEGAWSDVLSWPLEAVHAILLHTGSVLTGVESRVGNVHQRAGVIAAVLRWPLDAG
jgi:hypothetical protein